MTPSTAGNGSIQFRIGPFPVRIEPMFWVTAALLGVAGGDQRPEKLVAWVLAALLATLFHELGHAWLQRTFGGAPWIVLHAFGGYSATRSVPSAAWKRIAVALAGPFAGFLLAAAIVAALTMMGASPQWNGRAVVFNRFSSEVVQLFVYYLLWANIWWGIFNLLPIFPLDGWHVVHEVTSIVTGPRWGARLALGTSILVAIAIAVWFVSRGQWLSGALVASLATQSLQALQLHGGWRR